MPWRRRLRLPGCQPHPLQRGQLRITGHLLRLRHGFHLGLALPFALGRKTTGAALAPVRGGDSGAWIARFTRHSPAPCVPPQMRPDWRSTPISTRVTSRGTVARLEGCTKKHAVPQRCREAFAPHLARHHRMPCRRDRDNRGQTKAGRHLTVADLALPLGVVILLNCTVHPQCPLALCSLQHLRWYLVPPVVLKKACHRGQQEVLPWCCPAPLPASCPANRPRPAGSAGSIRPA